MRKIISLAVGISTAVAMTATGSVFAAGTIKIGDINSYTRLPGHTVPYKKGAQLAIEEINAKGGVLGKKLEQIMQCIHRKQMSKNFILVENGTLQK